ncbi:hypothetical protein [Halobiforma nitratireducens]|nr:hypothetical protein [Halobiforma nitratireducens]
MALGDLLPGFLRQSDDVADDGVLRECRHCGSKFDDPVDRCHVCGATEIATYEFVDAGTGDEESTAGEEDELEGDEDDEREDGNENGDEDGNENGAGIGSESENRPDDSDDDGNAVPDPHHDPLPDQPADAERPDRTDEPGATAGDETENDDDRLSPEDSDHDGDADDDGGGSDTTTDTGSDHTASGRDDPNGRF